MADSQQNKQLTTADSQQHSKCQPCNQTVRKRKSIFTDIASLAQTASSPPSHSDSHMTSARSASTVQHSPPVSPPLHTALLSLPGYHYSHALWPSPPLHGLHGSHLLPTHLSPPHLSLSHLSLSHLAPFHAPLPGFLPSPYGPLSVTVPTALELKSSPPFVTPHDSQSASCGSSSPSQVSVLKV